MMIRFVLAEPGQDRILPVDAFVHYREQVGLYVGQNAGKGRCLANKHEAKVMLRGPENLLGNLRYYQCGMSFGEFAAEMAVGEFDMTPDNSMCQVEMSLSKSEQPVCARCRIRSMIGWPARSDVGDDSEHPELCLKCAEAVCASA